MRSVSGGRGFEGRTARDHHRTRKLNAPGEYSRCRDARKPFFRPACDGVLHDFGVVERRGDAEGGDEGCEGQGGVYASEPRGSNGQQDS